MFARRCFFARDRLATACNRPRLGRFGHAYGLWGVLQKWSLLEVSNVVQPRFVWQASSGDNL